MTIYLFARDFDKRDGWVEYSGVEVNY